MPQNITKYKIFLASPSDLAEERNAIEDVISELNSTYGTRNEIVLELLKWETHSVPGISLSHPQELINTDLGQDYDLFVGMLWSKFGTPTNQAESGTEEEFNLAYLRAVENPNSLKVLFYFKNSPKMINEIDVDQLKKINDFKRKLGDKNVLYGEFDSTENFKQYLRMHIPTRIDDLRISLLESDKNFIDSNTEEYNNKMELGLLDYSDSYSEFLNIATHSLERIIESTKWIGSEISKKASELARIQKSPNPNKETIRLILERTAQTMNDYTDRTEIEIPIFYSNFENAINAGINLINILSDFNNEDNINELENTKKAIFELKAGMINAISGMGEFYNAIDELPRIEKNINTAKQRMSAKVYSLMVSLKDALKLTEEFSKQIGDRIDQMKLANL